MKTIANYKPRKFIENEPIAFFHYYADGEIQYQGQILELTKNKSGKVNFFDWIAGFTMEEYHWVTRNYFDDCVFFDSDFQMNQAYHKHKEENNEQR
jgi:hypothetical protein